MQKIIYKSPAWLYTTIVTLAIIYLTLVPKPLPDIRISLWEHTDKVVHAIMFGGFVAACCLDYMRKYQITAISKRNMLIIIAIASIFGGIIEILQNAMGIGRSGDYLDFIADFAGIMLFASISPAIIRKLFLPQNR